MRRILPLIPVLVALLAPLVATPAAEAKKPLVGIGDQNFLMFRDKRFQRLDLQLTRFALPWNWYRSAGYVAFVDQWVADARAAGVRPLIAFNRDWGKRGATYRVPSSLLRKSFKLFRARYPDITDFTAWNEANHTTQPTSKSPRLAARYYKTLKAACPRKCRITAADVLDTNDAASWLIKFKKYAPGARLWGVHSYKDPNNGTTWHTRQLMRILKGEIWLTETGGIKRLKPDKTSKGNGRFNTLHGQARAVNRVYALAKAYPKRIKRIYFYQWQQDPKARWDSAFLDHKGKVRPAYTALRKGKGR